MVSARHMYCLPGRCEIIMPACRVYQDCMDMELHRLRTFVAVAEIGSLSGASDVLRIAQPALSRQIRLLEEEVGQQLFTRSHAGMRLTPAGGELLGRVSGLLRQLEQSLDEVRSFAQDPAGEVTIAMVPTVCAVVAEALVRRVARELPQVRLRLIEGYTSHILDWLHQREVDMAVIYGPAIDLHLRARTLATDELVLIAAAGQGPAPGPVAVADLAEKPLILPGSQHGLRLVIEKAAEERSGIRLTIAVEAGAFATSLELVAAGLGWTVLPGSTAARFAADGRFEIRPFAPRLSRQVVLAEPPGKPATRAIERVTAILSEETERMLR
ncbi:LysR family transcriptional regulator [Sinirhodobacter populi]|uniref:LysR family transcriptional regulator n=2 Tax=Paenirhodobacter populi TaxID=2306993 RepID=A0A443K7Y4_9RHOB|nr:LysR family transcriptional regulator [Sinirhodobacter populi]